jgi:hypothetical protein
MSRHTRHKSCSCNPDEAMVYAAALAMFGGSLLWAGVSLHILAGAL